MLETLKRTPLIIAAIPFATLFPVQTEQPLGMYDIITLPHLNSLGFWSAGMTLYIKANKNTSYFQPFIS